MSKFQIGIFQMDISWSDIKTNQGKIEKLLLSQLKLPQVIILPETFTTGFLSNPSSLDKILLSKQLKWMQSLSRKFDVSLIGSVIFPIGEHYVNRMFFTSAKGSYQYYDKRHLFLEEKEKGFFIKGKERVVFSLESFSIFPLICYDLRFPVWARNNLGYQIMVVSANWPVQRQVVWDTLLKARAIENQSYVIGVNRVGVDGNKISYNGGSVVINPKGTALLRLGSVEEYQTIELDIEELNEFRARFPVILDADSFKIKK